MIWIKRSIQLAVVASIAGFIVYTMKFAPVSAIGHEIQRATIVDEVLGTGTLEARVSATISSKISGRIRQLHVDQGDIVKVGDALLSLEDEELRQQVAIAEANREAAVAAIQRLTTDKKRAQSISEQATRTYERIEKLIEQMAVSQEEADKANEALAIASAGVSLAEAAINEGQKALIAAEKNLEFQRARLADTQILAPFDGMIVRRDREPGDVVVPGSQILSLISLDELWISAWVDETAISKLEVDQPARVVLRSVPNTSFEGKVVRLGRETDRETREFLVDVQVLNLPDTWAVGQRAEVYIESDRRDKCVALPAEFLQLRDNEKGAQVLRNGTATWQPIEQGLRSRDLIEVVSGLVPGDTVIRSGDLRQPVPDGRAVETR